MNAVSQVGAARVCGGLHSCDEVYCLHSSCTTINRDTTVLGRHANTPCILNRYTQLRMHIMPPFRYTQLHMHVIPPFLSPVSHSSFSPLLPFSRPHSLSLHIPLYLHTVLPPCTLHPACTTQFLTLQRESLQSEGPQPTNAAPSSLSSSNSTLSDNNYTTVAESRR